MHVRILIMFLQKLSLRSTLTRRTIPQAMFSCKAKLPILSVVSVAAVFFFLVYVNSMVSMSLFSFGFKTTETPELLHIHSTGRLMKSTTARIPLRAAQEEIGDEDNTAADQKPPVPPPNLTVEERIAWFREKLPEFEIFKSNNTTRQFHSRVVEFFDHDCEVRFFMTWISPTGSFGNREFLAMESLLQTHPRGCLMIVSRTMDSGRGYRILKPLVDRGFKVVAVSPDLPSLFTNTPAAAWFDQMKSGNKDPGAIPLAQNLSNLIRLAVLYKYGGVYLDTDFVVLKSFKGLRNTIGAQSIDAVSMKWSRLNNAVLIFDSGHPLLFKFMEEFASTFDGNKWGHNGPYLVSRVTAKVQGRAGYNFTVLPPMAFYPVSWIKIDGFFRKPQIQRDIRWTEAKLVQLSEETYGVHLWNKATRGLTVEEGSIMARLISDHCVICQDVYAS